MGYRRSKPLSEVPYEGTSLSLGLRFETEARLPGPDKTLTRL